MTKTTWKRPAGISASIAVCAVAAFATSSAARNAASMPHKATEKSTDSNRSDVLVELFTSEGCSSCPPADTLLQELRKNQPVPGARIIALSEHVDYWDRLGWKDPYSAKEYSARQSDYATSFKNHQVYTPQMVVDGSTEFVGSDRNAAQAAIARAGKQPKASISLSAKNGVLSVRITDLPKGAANSDVYVAVIEDSAASSVRRGENAGRRLTHTAVARQLARIGTIPAGAGKTSEATFRPKRLGSQNNQSIVVFVQEGGTRRILGAEEAPLAG